MYAPHQAREDTTLFPELHKIVSPSEYDAMGEQFESIERKTFGSDGFDIYVDKVAALENRPRAKISLRRELVEVVNSQLLSVYLTQGIVVASLAMACGLANWCGFARRRRRAKESEFPYVSREDREGPVELTGDEKDHLNTRFHRADVNRPYFKFRYESLTPDGRISGFLEPRPLPAKIQIRPAPVVVAPPEMFLNGHENG